MLRIDPDTGRMWCADGTTVFADRPYVYSISGRSGNTSATCAGLTRKDVESKDGETVITALFGELRVGLRQRFRCTETCIEETISLKNLNPEPVTLSDIGLGFAAEIGGRPEWRLCAIPFAVQLDGSRHDYSTADLIAGNFHNAVYRDKTRDEPPLIEDGRLRSEAWAWRQGHRGLVIIKYNNKDIELSVSARMERDGEHLLRFGGAGTCLYGEPSAGHCLAPECEFMFGTTYYCYFEGPVENAFRRYRDFLDARGHCFPPDYDPPVNWNELYDIGWYHSDAGKLRKHYTRGSLLGEAQKAKDCGCQLLYLDPGWEKAEGTTLWDETRLGPVADMIAVLANDYGLQLGFRTILRCYQEHWPLRHMIQHPGKTKGPIEFSEQRTWEPCLCDRSFWEQKVERIFNIARHGVRFLMVDEMDWRGPCWDPDHGHEAPTKAVDHVRAVYDLCRELRRRCPGLTIECHDPVWPWHTSIYVPSYYGQGFGNRGAYEENWGFEYMWNCIEDLKSGKALALYYYNLACNIPLYLHITMAADNDACLFFWWAASTVRHLGIGGRNGHESVNPKDMAPHDPGKRFAAYRKQMALYRRLKPYFARGVFHGLTEHLHLHTLPSRKGGVLTMFNLTDADRILETHVGRELLQSDGQLRVKGADGRYEDRNLKISAEVPAMSPAVVCIGDAADAYSEA